MAVVLPSRSRGRTRSRNSSRRRSSSGSTEWVASNSYVTAHAPDVPVVLFEVVPNAVIKTMTSPTFLGGHVEVLASAMTVPPDVYATSSVGLGICVLPQRTFETWTPGDPPTFPLPWSDAEGDWPYLRIFYLIGSDLAGASSDLVTDRSVVRFHDVARSKRRVTEDDALVGIVEMFGTTAVPPQGAVSVEIATRLLLRQP